MKSLKYRMAYASCTLLMAFVFSLFFCQFNTPLGPSIGSDNAMYMTMGTALANGYAPYVDIFDHKGPMLFLLQWLPQEIAGGYSTLAVFIQEVLFLFACLCVLGDIACRLNAPVFASQIVYLALTASLVDGGNLTEQYSNLFTLIALDAAVMTFSNGMVPRKEEKKLSLPSFILGAMTMLAFLMRANNALPLVTMTLAISAVLLLMRRYAALGRCALFFIAGCLAAALPIIIWLAGCGALYESFYGSILHNLMYVGTGSTSRMYMLFHTGYGRTAMVIAFIVCLGALALVIRKRIWILPVGMIAGALGAGLAAFISRKFYLHYLAIGVPMSALGACVLLGEIDRIGKKKKRIILCVVMIMCLGWIWNQGAKDNAQRISECEKLDQYVMDAQALYAQVPEEDRDRFMAYRVEPKWYVASGALPCMRFYFLQEVLAEADPAVMDEIVMEFLDDPPLWVVIYYNREFGPPYDARVQEIFDTRYEFVDAKGQYQLLRLRDEAK